MKVAPEINLKLAKKLPTKSRIEYLDDKVDIKTVKDAYTAFAKYLNDDNTDVFFGKFGEKYETEDSDLKTYERFYAFNSKTRNMMFFREEETGTDKSYKLHAYMKLNNKKANYLEQHRKIFN